MTPPQNLFRTTTHDRNLTTASLSNTPNIWQALSILRCPVDSLISFCGRPGFTRHCFATGQPAWLAFVYVSVISQYNSGVASPELQPILYYRHQLLDHLLAMSLQNTSREVRGISRRFRRPANKVRLSTSTKLHLFNHFRPYIHPRIGFHNFCFYICLSP